MPFLRLQLRDMVRLQRKIGCRPEEVAIIRPCDVDRSVDPWIYIPNSHKTEHHGRSRKIPIGAEGQKILLPWLDRPENLIALVRWNPEKPLTQSGVKTARPHIRLRA